MLLLIGLARLAAARARVTVFVVSFLGRFLHHFMLAIAVECLCLDLVTGGVNQDWRSDSLHVVQPPAFLTLRRLLTKLVPRVFFALIFLDVV